MLGFSSDTQSRLIEKEMVPAWERRSGMTNSEAAIIALVTLSLNACFIELIIYLSQGPAFQLLLKARPILASVGRADADIASIEGPRGFAGQWKSTVRFVRCTLIRS
ncbi:MAG TPA: hypothetical protein DCE44_05020 [Verrucomicrobiales bacterium]|nr:hypothetical protein [Verrucomicrobiales bacterium]